MRCRSCHGFTVIEAVVCLAIIGVTLVLATSLCTRVLDRADASNARSALLSSLTRSIHHAALAGTEVVLCPGDRQGCRNTFDWSGGWIAFADIDGDRRRDHADTLLLTQPALSGRIRLITSTGRRRLVFQPTGGNTGSNVTFTLCNTRRAGKTLSLVLANDGRLRSGKAAGPAIRACRKGS